MDHGSLIDVFRLFLREHNLPVTAQRLAIADIVLRSGEHMSAEDVMIELGARGAYAGTATVYRTLELLQRSGVLVVRDFGEGFKRYVAAHGEPPHEHLQCDRCGRIVEVPSESARSDATGSSDSTSTIAAITESLAARHGFRRTGHRLVVNGICADCLRNDTIPGAMDD